MGGDMGPKYDYISRSKPIPKIRISQNITKYATKASPHPNGLNKSKIMSFHTVFNKKHVVFQNI